MGSYERPGLLTFGIFMTGLHAFICLIGLAFAGLVAMGTLSAAAFQFSGGAWLPLTVVGSIGGAVVVLLALFYGFCLMICWKAWHGSRPWIWALIVVTVLGLVSTGPISALIGIATLVGAIQALERLPQSAYQ